LSAVAAMGGFIGSKRSIEVLTGNLLMLMVMALVFSSVAFMVKKTSDNYSLAKERELVDGISAYLRSKVSEAWGVGADEVPLTLPELAGSAKYTIESDPSGNYLIVKTPRSRYKIRSGGIVISKGSIDNIQPHSIGIRDGRVVIDPPPLTEIVQPLDGSVFNGPFNVSYRTSSSTTEHRIYLDGTMVANSSTTLDGFRIDPSAGPTYLADGQHILRVVGRSLYGEGEDFVRFVIDRSPPQVELKISQIMTGELIVSVTQIRTTGEKVEIYIHVSDNKGMPVRELDVSNFYIYNSGDEFLQGGRFALSVSAVDSESRVDPRSYVIAQEAKGVVDLTRSRETIWDSKNYNGTVTFWAVASDIAGNAQASPNATRTPVSRPIDVGPPDRKSDLSVIFCNDVSGSMEWVMWKDELPKPGEESRLDFMKPAVKSFIDRMYPEDEAAICSFTTNYDTGLVEIVLRADFTATDPAGKAALAATVDSLVTRDGTPLYDALYQSVLWVRERSKYRVVVALTDGKDLNYATGQPYSTRTWEEVVDLAVLEGIPIYCVGLGEEDRVDVAVLNAISQQTHGRFYLAPTPEKLQEAYDQIAGELLCGYKLEYRTGYLVAGGERVTLVVYDKQNRSGMLELVLPAPEPEEGG